MTKNKQHVSFRAACLSELRGLTLSVPADSRGILNTDSLVQVTRMGSGWEGRVCVIQWVEGMAVRMRGVTGGGGDSRNGGVVLGVGDFARGEEGWNGSALEVIEVVGVGELGVLELGWGCEGTGDGNIGSFKVRRGRGCL